MANSADICRHKKLTDFFKTVFVHTMYTYSVFRHFSNELNRYNRLDPTNFLWTIKQTKFLSLEHLKNHVGKPSRRIINYCRRISFCSLQLERAYLLCYRFEPIGCFKTLPPPLPLLFMKLWRSSSNLSRSGGDHRDNTTSSAIVSR